MRVGALLSESGFAGLWGFQDSDGGRVFYWWEWRGWDAAARVCQNQDFQDYGIFRILTAGVFSIGGAWRYSDWRGLWLWVCGEKRKMRETES